MDIQIGEYVRTKSGFIGKIIGKHGGYGLYYELDVKKELQDNKINGIVYEDNIVKHSKNIIDLIEVGDYVNGDEIITIYGYDEDGNDKDELGICEVDDDYAYYKCLEEIDIKTILTHEQYEQNCYRRRKKV